MAGTPRRLVSVDYVGRDIDPPLPAPARPAHFRSNEDAPRGRLILLLVDRGNIGRGQGREVLRAADRFLDTVAPADRVGLAFVPGPLTEIEFTADTASIRRGLGGVVGTADRDGYSVPLTRRPWPSCSTGTTGGGTSSWTGSGAPPGPW